MHDVAATRDFLAVRAALRGDVPVPADLLLADDLRREAVKEEGPDAAKGGSSMSTLRIAHISDLHCGSPHFQAELLERAIEEINELQPGVTVISGDLTSDGFRGEYQVAREFVDRIECEQLIVVPGNHDSRNVGYVHFEEMFGPRHSELHANGVSIVAEDSSEPDLNHGQIGRNRYEHIEQSFSQPGRPAHLRAAPPPAARSPGPAASATSCTTPATCSRSCCGRASNLVLAGHKHVPYAWRLEDLFVVTTGTVSTLRLRGHTRPCYNVIEIDPQLGADRAPVSVRRPGADHRVVARDAPRIREGRPPASRVEWTGEPGAAMRVIALVDGEHHPGVARAALDRLEQEHDDRGACCSPAGRRRSRPRCSRIPLRTTGAT